MHGGDLMGLGFFLDVWACYLFDELHRSALADMGAAPMSGRFIINMATASRGGIRVVVRASPSANFANNLIHSPSNLSASLKQCALTAANGRQAYLLLVDYKTH